MNEELRQVLGVQQENQTKQGLYIKMFKNYNLTEDLANIKDEKYSYCIHTLIENEEWPNDDDRFFELDILGCEVTREIDRVFTQIRKVTVNFKGQPAMMLLIRNITHIINYEKAKNEGKY